MGRIQLTEARPATPTGHPAKGAVGEVVPLSVVIFRDGHDRVAGQARVRPKGSRTWTVVPLAPASEELFTGSFRPASVGAHDLVFDGWTDRFGTWRDHTAKRAAAQTADLDVELLVGADLLDELGPLAPADQRELVSGVATTLRSTTCTTRTKLDAALDDRLAAVLATVADPHDLTELATPGFWVDREHGPLQRLVRAVPPLGGGHRRHRRLQGSGAAAAGRRRHGLRRRLPAAHPPHRARRTARGKGNTLTPGPDDPGSPWAIGSAEGGHTAIHPDLGTSGRLRRLPRPRPSASGMEVALDYALQCSPDHPWVHEHPEWFHHRPDGSIRYAENPPKKYQDIYPINFWPDDDADRVALWEACRDVLEHWIGHGVASSGSTTPTPSRWRSGSGCIADVRSRHPDVLFLAEAFTRPKVMARAGRGRVHARATRTSPGAPRRGSCAEYGEELAGGPSADYMRPNFWPNTPDILTGPLRGGSPVGVPPARRCWPPR